MIFTNNLEEITSHEMKSFLVIPHNIQNREQLIINKTNLKIYISQTGE